jgi:hypothetical protein
VELLNAMAARSQADPKASAANWRELIVRPSYASRDQ